MSWVYSIQLSLSSDFLLPSIWWIPEVDQLYQLVIISSFTWSLYFLKFEIQCSIIFTTTFHICGSDGKASAYNAGHLGSVCGSGRSSGEGNGNPLQYPCLDNPMKGGAWRATVHGIEMSRTQLSNFTFTCNELQFFVHFDKINPIYCKLLPYNIQISAVKLD